MEKKIKLTKQQLWDFTYKEICNNFGISKFDFAISKNYNGFKRRFDYFIKGLKEAVHKKGDKKEIKRI